MSLKSHVKRQGPHKAFIYLRLSVDKENGNAQSIEAQRHAIQAFAASRDIEIVGEFVDSGMSGQTDRRPGFQQMLAQATSDARPVDLILMYAISRIARNISLFLQTLETLAEAGVEVISTTENFGTGKGQRLANIVTALIAEEQARDAAVLTRKSRRENARQGFFNGGPVAFGYRTYVARQDGEKSRMRLEVVPEEADVIRRIFDWADQGRGGRWIVTTLNSEGATMRGAKFSNSNVAAILTRETYIGQYRDRTADDDGNRPEIEDAIIVPCPAIIEREQFERVAATRIARSPRNTAPHVAAGTTLLTGIARCGMSDCGSGLTIRTGKGGRYAYYSCNARVNRGEKCACPNIRREQLDGIVLELVEKKILAKDRLRQLLAEVLDLSDQQRERRAAELAAARSEQTRAEKAISQLLILVEEGVMAPRDPQFAERMAANRAKLAAVTSRIQTLEVQLAHGRRRITEAHVDRFGALLSEKLRDEDPALRSAYLRMFVSEVSVSEHKIVVSGPMAALERGATAAALRPKAVVPTFDRKWCPRPDSNQHALRRSILSRMRLPFRHWGTRGEP